MIAYTLGRPLLRPCMALDLIVIRTRVLRIKVPSSFCTQIEDIFQTVLVWKPLNLKESLTASKNLPHILKCHRNDAVPTLAKPRPTENRQ